MPSKLTKYGHRLLNKAFTPTPKGILPEGDYYTILWQIPEAYGGLTTVSLARASAFARQDNRRITILTFGFSDSGRDREAELRAEGRLDKRVSIRNLWEDLRSWSDEELRRMEGTAKIDESALDDVLDRTSKDWRETRTDSSGTELQGDVYDRRGRLLLIDRKDCRKRGTKSGRRLTLVDSKKQIIGQWRSATAFYKAWLDVIFGDRPSYVICDSGFAGNLFHSYRRDNVILCQAIHSAHINGRKCRTPEMHKGKFPLIWHLDQFDRGIALTHAQKNDLIESLHTAGNVRVISNLIADLHGDAEHSRKHTHGEIIARLSGQKRLDHAIQAFARAQSRVPELTVNVYGEGDMRKRLEELAVEEGVSDSFVLKGHDPNAKQKLHDASFLVLSSSHEGQGLVLLESMSAGCIPIAYDIDYGPSEIITDGVDGFLVPAGDIDALAQAIVTVATMDDADLRTMRRNAISRAKDFYEDAIVRKWAEMFAECSFDPIHPSKATAELASLTVTDSVITLEANVEDHSWTQTEHTFISWRLAGKNYYGRAQAEFDGTTLRGQIPLDELRHLPAGDLEISADFVDGRSFHRTRISTSLGRTHLRI